MKSVGFKVATIALLVFAVLTIGWNFLIDRVDPAATPAAMAKGPSVSGGGVTLVSDSIDLPDTAAALPAGAAGELITQHCTACHSVEMITAQPHLAPEKWQATVEKMRVAYKAPIAPGDDQALVAALVSFQQPPKTDGK
jgi:mono/diheme cytochrome c family protein